MHANKNSRTRAAANVSAARRTASLAALGALLLQVFRGTALVAHVSLDRRSLAAGRVLLGALVVVDVWCSRWPFRRLLYSDAGMWPRALVLAGKDPQIHPADASLYVGFGGARWAGAACVLAAVAGACAMVGFHTQLALGYCWLHLYSMAYRCSGCQQAGDTLMRMVVFWSMFLPCGEVWSVDAVLLPSAPPATMTVTSLACVGVLTQLGLVYAFCAMFKITSAWRDGTAIDSVLKNFAFCTGLRASSKYNFVVRLLYAVPAMPYVLTCATVVVEHSAPLFLFCAPLRGLGCAIFCGFHFGLYSTMRLGIFPLVCMAAWVMVLPGYVWGGMFEVDAVGVGIGLGSGGSGGVAAAAASGTCDSGGAAAAAGLAGLAVSMWSWHFDMVVHIFLVGVQTAALVLAIACNVNTLPFESCSNVVTAEMYVVARVLGVQQQWFLFDKPARNSFWYRILGEVEVEAEAEAGSRVGKEGESSAPSTPAAATTTVDLHRFMLRLQAEDSRFGFGVGDDIDVDGLAYSPFDSVEARAWEECFGNHRWRKLFQKLTDSRNRFLAFRMPYARFLQAEWNRRMAGRGGYGRLRKVTHIGCAIPIDPTQSLEEWEAHSKTPWNPMRKIAWEIDFHEKKMKKKEKMKLAAAGCAGSGT